MTLEQIIVDALRRLERGTDTQTLKAYRRVFTTYANAAIKRIADVFEQCRKETVDLDDEKMFAVSALSHGCWQIISIRDSKRDCYFQQDPPGSGLVRVHTLDHSVTVTYRFVPRELSATSDVPELPEFAHDLIHYYIVACARAGGDPDTQNTASVDFQLFESKLSRLAKSTLGEPESYRLRNWW